MIYFNSGFKKPFAPIFLIAFGLLVFVSGCYDNQITEIDLPEQNSLDTQEAYLKAIAKAQTHLVSHASSAMREMDEEEFEKVMRNVEEVIQRSPIKNPIPLKMKTLK
ncbi:MAG: hypothetical protein OXF08_05030 [Bacteroidetes bacterium]|nr:hypothetical protein [Bacteroidota bacterium]